jgi:hypothetical protein
MRLWLLVLPILHLGVSVQASNPDLLRLLGPQGVNLWKLEKAAAAGTPKLFVQEEGYIPGQETEEVSGFRPQWFRQPVDHFSDSSNATFRQRYWVNTRHYKAGSNAPVIVLDGGETSGEVSQPSQTCGLV